MCFSNNADACYEVYGKESQKVTNQRCRWKGSEGREGGKALELG